MFFLNASLAHAVAQENETDAKSRKLVYAGR